MTRLYLDIETYRKDKRDAFINERIIVIGILEDWSPYSEESLSITLGSKVNFKVFSEWELRSEETVVRRFYEYLNNLITKSEFLVIVGFNILRFDIPLLIQKGVEYGVGSLSDLNKLWHNTFTIDLFQVALPLNKMLFKGNTLENIADKARKYGINIPSTYGRGEDVPRWYEERKYDEIVKHLKADLKVMRHIDLAKAITKVLVKTFRA